MPKMPNILLVVTDQWRGDCVGALGHPVVETPNIDNVFEEGTFFTRAFSAVPSCIAARASLLTGLSQNKHGRVGYRDGVPWNYPVTLPGLLSEAGYHTHCVGKMHVFPPRNLMGFHSVQLHDGYLGHSRRKSSDYSLLDDYLPWFREKCGNEVDLTDTGLGSNGYSVRPWPYEERYHPTNWVTTQAVDFLRRRDVTKPFFLKVSYHRPHPPLDPPQYYLDRYLDKDITPVNTGEWSSSNPLTRRGTGEPVPDSPAQIELGRKAYYAHLTHIDCQLNRIIRTMREHNVLDDTLIIFVSDHGEMLYDHNLVGKGMAYNASTGIPFALKLPGCPENSRARRVENPVELRDILPTCLDAAGVPVPDSIEGRSVLPLCRGENVSWREYIHGEHSSPYQERANQWINTGKELYVWFSLTGEEQYFRVDSDPENKNDLAGEYPQRTSFFRKKLAEELKNREEGFVHEGGLVPGRPSKSVLDSSKQGDV